MPQFLIRRLTVVAVALIATALLVGATSGSLHAQSTTTGTAGACDQYDSFCNYCANNAGTDLCQPGANPSMVAIPTMMGSGPMMGGRAMLMGGSSMMTSGSTSSSSTTTASTGSCDQFDSFCNYCSNNPDSDLCQPGANPSMVSPGGSSQMMMSGGSTMAMGSMPPAMGMSDNMAGTSWVWCGGTAVWVPMPSPVWGWPC